MASCTQTCTPTADSPASRCPDDVWTHLMSYLEGTDLARTQAVCTILRPLAESPFLWQALVVRRPA